MKIKLLNTFANTEARLAQIDRELTELEIKLKTPARTVDDLIRHIELLKEKQQLI